MIQEERLSRRGVGMASNGAESGLMSSSDDSAEIDRCRVVAKESRSSSWVQGVVVEKGLEREIMSAHHLMSGYINTNPTKLEEASGDDGPRGSEKKCREEAKNDDSARSVEMPGLLEMKCVVDDDDDDDDDDDNGPDTKDRNGLLENAGPEDGHRRTIESVRPLPPNPTHVAGHNKLSPTTTTPCPRCNSTHTKFCYFNNYNVNQPRHFCKKCQRYWTAGGTLRNVPLGSGKRRNKAIKLNDVQMSPFMITTSACDIVNNLKQGLSTSFPSKPNNAANAYGLISAESTKTNGHPRVEANNDLNKCSVVQVPNGLVSDLRSHGLPQENAKLHESRNLIYHVNPSHPTLNSPCPNLDSKDPHNLIRPSTLSPFPLPPHNNAFPNAHVSHMNTYFGPQTNQGSIYHEQVLPIMGGLWPCNLYNMCWAPPGTPYIDGTCYTFFTSP